MENVGDSWPSLEKLGVFIDGDGVIKKKKSRKILSEADIAEFSADNLEILMTCILTGAQLELQSRLNLSRFYTKDMSAFVYAEKYYMKSERILVVVPSVGHFCGAGIFC